MRYKIVLSIMFLLLVFSNALSQWDYYRLPGGVELETVIVDDGSVQGMWIVEKQGGMYWVPWDNGWGTMVGFNEESPWWMGGDYRNISSTEYSLAAGYLGLQRYDYSSGWTTYLDMIPNEYYRWHDAAYYNTPDDSGKAGHFITCAVQEWSASNYTADKGLFLIDDGLSPASGADPITDTEDNHYAFIYRDLEIDSVLYTWYNEESPDCAEFQKVVVYYDQGATLTADAYDDFDVASDSLIKITCFYQYLKGDTLRCQYMVAKTDSSRIDAWDVWYREESGGSLESTGWSDLDVLSRTEQSIGDGAFGITGHKDGTDHHIYIVSNKLGLVYWETGGSIQYLNREDDYSSYLPNYSARSLNYNPWYNGGSDDDQLIIGSGHGGLELANIDPAQSSASVDDFFELDGITNSGGIKCGGSPRGWAATNDSVYLVTHGSGIYALYTEPSVELDNRVIGTIDGASGTWTNNSDFNFSLKCCTFSDFDSLGKRLYMGTNSQEYYLNGTSLKRSGLWRLNVADADSQPVKVNCTGIDSKSIYSMADGEEDEYLYLGVTDAYAADVIDFLDNEYPSVLCAVKYENSTYSAETMTDTYSEVAQMAWPTWISTFNANFTAVAKHPADGVTGAVYGMGVGNFVDWGEEPGSGDNLQYWGGGLGYAYWSGSAWIDERILKCDHGDSSSTTLKYFEIVQDMLVETNTDYDEEHLNVDILAATAAYQNSHWSEDIPRYGGLFAFYYDTTESSWDWEDLTPHLNASNNYFYQLGSSVGLTNPSVLSIESVDLGGDTYYFCSTLGEKYDTSDEWLSLLWYQQADDIRSLDQDSWNLFGGTGQVNIDGTIVNGFYSQLVLMADNSTPSLLDIIIGAFPLVIENVLMPSTNTITDSVTWDGPVNLNGDITIGTNGVLTLDNDDSTCVITALGDYQIIVDGGELRMVNADAGNKVLLEGSQDGTWGGIEFNDLADAAVDTIQYLEVTDADYGIKLSPASGDTVKLCINHCRLEDDSIGIFASYPDYISIENCTVENSGGKGIYIMGAETAGTDTHQVKNCEILGGYHSGIYLSQCSDKIRVLENYIHDNIEVNISSCTSHSGIYSLMSSPEVYSDSIVEPNGFVVYTSGTSAPDFTGDANYFEKSDDGISAYSYSTIYSGSSTVFPDLDSSRCTIVNIDESSNKLIVRYIGDTSNRNVEYNYWKWAADADGDPPDSCFYPENTQQDIYYDYDPYLASPDVLGGFSYGTASLTTNPYELLDEAEQEIQSGDFTEAYSIFDDIIDNYPSFTEPVCRALIRMSNIASDANVSVQTQHEYFDDVVDTHENEIAVKVARQLRNNCSLVLGNYSTVISDYESIVNNPACLEDSVFAVLNINYIYLLMDHMGVQTTQSTHPSVNYPVCAVNYSKKEAELMALLHYAEGAGNGTAQELIPEVFELQQNYPNPFNPVTNIKYNLPELSNVKLEIFNILGQKVITIVDGLENPGYKKVLWKGDSNSGIPVASGIYIYRLQATGKESGTEFVKCRKMIMLK